MKGEIRQRERLLESMKKMTMTTMTLPIILFLAAEEVTVTMFI